jgi:heparosan-N-sulfate-glucuronate 5-epimerase
VNQRALLLTVTVCVLSIAACACAFEKVALETHEHSTRGLFAVVLIAVTVCIAYLLSSWDFDYDRRRVIINPFDPFARSLGRYYIAFPNHRQPSHADDAGIPLLYLGPLNRFVYFTIYIAQCGLQSYSSLLESPDDIDVERHRFLSYAEWILKSLTRHSGDFGLWVESSFRFGHRIRPPWSSAMAQGEGISVLLRAYELSEDKRFLEGASLAFGAFLVPVQAGGLRTTIDGEFLFFDEYPATPPTRVLNGFIWALLGIWDLYRATDEPAARRVFFDAIRTLRHILPRYDRGGWSRYALYEGGGPFYKVDCPASAHYHLTHIAQLRVLHQITGDPIFLDMADRWDRSKDCLLTKVRVWMLSRVVFRLQRVGAKARLAFDVIRES